MNAIRYDVEVGGARIQVDADPEKGICLADTGRTADIVPVDGESWSVILGGRSYTLHVKRTADALRMRGRGPEVAVQMESERSRLLKLAGASAPRPEHGTRISAPMPALVMRIEVTAGQEVAAGQGLIVLEAMKMENEIRAPRAGRIASVPARVGSPVEKGEVLVILE